MRAHLFFSDTGHGCAGRHSRHRWRGHFTSAGFDGDRGWGDMFRAGRMLAAGDMRLIVLALLEEKPRHGYDLIKAIEDRTRGFYAPSPGVIYPTLTYLEEIGYAQAESEGAKKLYHITDQGREHLTANRTEADALLSQLERVGEKIAHVRRWFGDDTDETHAAYDSLHEARQELKAAMREKRGASAEDLARIAEIVRRAAKDIRGR